MDIGEFNGRRLYTGRRLNYRLSLWALTSVSRAVSALAELLVIKVEMCGGPKAPQHMLYFNNFYLIFYLLTIFSSCMRRIGYTCISTFNNSIVLSFLDFL